MYTDQSSMQQALYLTGFIQDANLYTAREIAGFLAQVDVKVLTPELWATETYRSLIYGMVHFRDSNIIVLASEDNDFWKSLLPDTEQVPESLREDFLEAYTRDDGTLSSRGFFDLLGIHELAHLYQFQAGASRLRYWLMEFYCNLLLHTVVAESMPGHLKALEVLPMIMSSAPKDQFTYTTLRQFEDHYYKIGSEAPQNYGWYQFRFHDAARRVYDAAGKEVIGKLWQFHLDHREIADDEDLLRLLHDEVHPEVALMAREW